MLSDTAKSLLTALIIVMITITSVIIYSSFQEKFRLKDDNIIEEKIEEIIEDHLDITIDLSPDVCAYKMSVEAAKCAGNY
jgi:hypothetical protein